MEIPLDAVRETVINALTHRDWTRFVDIEITVYSDRMEVISPGSLKNSMTIEKMKTGQRSTRNQIIVDVLKDYGYVDARGMGIRTKVIPLMKATGREPVFEATEDYLKTILNDAQRENKSFQVDRVKEASIEGFDPLFFDVKADPIFNRSTGQVSDLLKFIMLYPKANYEQIAVALQVSAATVKRKIQTLKKENRFLGSFVGR